MAKKVSKKSDVPVCPVCRKELTDCGSLEITDVAQTWEMEAGRWQCDNGHVVLIGDTEVIENAPSEDEIIFEVGWGEEDDDEEDEDEEDFD